MMDFLFPKQCIWCDKYANYLCSYCRQNHLQFDLDKICHVCRREITQPSKYVHDSCRESTNIDRVEFVVRFNKLAQKIVSSIKYECYFDYTHLLTSLTLEKLDRKFFLNAVLVPVPLHSSKKKLRGFNQAELFARYLAKRLGKFGVVMPVINLLNRKTRTITQVGMDRTQRILNLKNVFEISSNVSRPKADTRIILVDDVYTTGTTLEECAKVLRENGFARVEGLVFGRD